MRNLATVVILILFCWLETGYIYHTVAKSVNLKEGVKTGQSRLFRAIIDGEVADVRRAISEGADLNGPLDPYIGENILQLGTPHIDFPACPPVHFAFYLGNQRQLTVAHFLITTGARLFDYRLPSLVRDGIDYGFPPAVLYALGMGRQDSLNSHAAFLQRLYKTHPHYFNMTKLHEWCQLTGNYPILQYTTAINNLDGLYTLIADIQLNVNDRDEYGMTALHIATWHGYLQPTIFLLHNGADMMLSDHSGRLPLHLAWIRRQIDLVTMLLGNILNDELTKQNATSTAAVTATSKSSTKVISKQKEKKIVEMILRKDYFGYDFIDLCLLSPRYLTGIHRLNEFLRIHVKKSMEELITSHTKMTSTNIESKIIQFKINSYQVLTNYMQRNEKKALQASLAIDVIDGDLVTKQEFLKAYHSTQRPVKIIGQITRGQSLWAYITSKDIFREHFGELETTSRHVITVAKKKISAIDNDDSLQGKEFVLPKAQQYQDWLCDKWNASSRNVKACEHSIQTQQYQSVSLRSIFTADEFRFEFPTNANTVTTSETVMNIDGGIDRTTTTTSTSNANTLISSHSSQALQFTITHEEHERKWFLDLSTPPFFQLCGTNDHESFRFSIMQRGSVMPLLRQNTTWDLVLFGKKKWLLFPPHIMSDEDVLYQVQQDLVRKYPMSTTATNEHDNLTPHSLFSRHWNKTHLDFLRRHPLLQYEVSAVSQSAQEVMYIPDSWGRIVYATSDTISVSQEICTFHNTHVRIQPLGPVLYGGEDIHRGLGFVSTPGQYKNYDATPPNEKKKKVPVFE